MICPHCGSSKTIRTCPSCGLPYCIKCGETAIEISSHKGCKGEEKKVEEWVDELVRLLEAKE